MLTGLVQSNDYFESASAGIDASNDLREVTRNEELHYKYILEQSTLQNHEIFSRNKEPHIHTILFQLEQHMERIEKSKRLHLRL
jgi:hypothetical protein